jgi:hypothetical protein
MVWKFIIKSEIMRRPLYLMREASSATLESAKKSTVAPEKFPLYSAHEIIHWVSSIHSVYLINIIKEISHSSATFIKLSHRVHDLWTKKTIEKGILGELIKSFLSCWRWLMIIGLLLLFRILYRILVSTNVEVVFAIIFIITTKLFTIEKISLDFVIILVDSDINNCSRNFLAWGIFHSWELDYLRNLILIKLFQADQKFHHLIFLRMKIFLGLRIYILRFQSFWLTKI